MALRTPLKAIRAKCLDCTCGQFIEIRECSVESCPLYEYRMGHRPKKYMASEGVNELEDLDEDFTTDDIAD